MWQATSGCFMSNKRGKYLGNYVAEVIYSAGLKVTRYYYDLYSTLNGCVINAAVDGMKQVEKITIHSNKDGKLVAIITTELIEKCEKRAGKDYSVINEIVKAINTKEWLFYV